MADNKIQISWDDVQSTRVDERLKQQAAISRSAQQTQQIVSAPSAMAPPFAAPSASKSILYNALFYMAVFGGIGGFCGWIGGEVVTLLLPNRLDEWELIRQDVATVVSLVRNGEITQAQADKRLEELAEQNRENPYVAILLNQSLAEAERDRQLKERREKDETKQTIQQFLFFTMIAVPLAFWLSVGDQVMSRNWSGALTCGSVALTLGLLGGGVVSLFINKIYQSLGGGGAASFGWQMIARAIGWSLLGAFMTIAPGVVLRNAKRLGIGIAGGLIGGLVGGALFDPLSALTHNVVVSRFVAIMAIGVLAGVGTGVIENAAKSGWLKVVAGLIAGKQFVLYRNPTIIGSSPQCEIYLFKDPQVGPRHAAIHVVGRSFEIESLHHATGTFVNGQPISRTRLSQGDQVQIGGTAFVFQEKDRSQLG